MTPGENDLCIFAVKRGSLEKRIDPHANHPKFQKVFSQLAKNNTIVPLGEISESIFSGITPKAGGDAYTQKDDGVLFLKSGCLSMDGTITIDKNSMIKPHIHNGIMKSSKLKKNDVLIAIVGATIGKVGLYNLEEDANINQAIAAVRLKSIILPEFLTYYLLSRFGQTYLNYLKRPVARANINLQEVAEIGIPLLSIADQKSFISSFKQAKKVKDMKIKHANDLCARAKSHAFDFIGITFSDYKPSIFSYQTLRDIFKSGIYCNPHSAYLNELFEQLRINKWYAGQLDEFVDINPQTDRSLLSDEVAVSFVPMPAVEEKTNHVEYETKKYREVKTGFTIFQQNDLLWAKITPCMQNGKSFLASDMPTDIGFASTEFHVLRRKSDQIYMPYLWVILSESHVLEAAQGMFSGSAGQQRVPDTFLKKFPIVLPPIELQKELANEVFAALRQSKEMKIAAEKEWAETKAEFERALLEG